jgi:drug/metabolite transporter (DMT)-like permease
MKNYKLAVMLLILATILWGSTFSFTKVLVATLPPMYLLGYRFLITALLIFLIYPKDIIHEFARGIGDKHLLLFALINIGAIGFQTYGIQFTTASNAGFITAFSVVFVPILKKLHYKTRISTQIYLAVFTALAGLYLISFGFGMPQSINRGDFFVFICALFYGYYIITLELVVKKFSAATTMFVSFGITAAACLLLGLIFEKSPALSTLIRPAVIFNMLGLAILGSVIAYLCMAWGQKHVKAEAAGIIYTLEPIFTLIIACFFLGESFAPWQMAGAGLVLAALFIGIRSQGNQSAMPA